MATFSEVARTYATGQSAGFYLDKLIEQLQGQLDQQRREALCVRWLKEVVSQQLMAVQVASALVAAATQFIQSDINRIRIGMAAEDTLSTLGEHLDTLIFALMGQESELMGGLTMEWFKQMLNEQKMNPPLAASMVAAALSGFDR